MTDYYKILGVGEQASPDEIKKAYRSLANKHHPDKGGDQARFKDISVAYDTLSNDQKRQEYDHQRRFPQGQQFHFNTGNPFQGGDPFAHMFGGGSPFGDIFGQMRGGHPGQRRNRDLNIQCQVSLLDSFTGKQVEASFHLPSGRQQTVMINVPAGINNGETIRYQGLGDDSVPQMPRGNLNVTVLVQPDPNFERRGDDLYTNVEITPIESMLGCRKTITKINGSRLDLEIRPGVETGTEFASGGQGFLNPNTRNRGRFVTVVKIKSKPVTDPMLVEKLRQLDVEIAQRQIKKTSAKNLDEVKLQIFERFINQLSR
jgi:DnaJ-class molecular chaperone